MNQESARLEVLRFICDQSNGERVAVGRHRVPVLRICGENEENEVDCVCIVDSERKSLALKSAAMWWSGASNRVVSDFLIVWKEPGVSLGECRQAGKLLGKKYLCTWDADDLMEDAWLSGLVGAAENDTAGAYDLYLPTMRCDVRVWHPTQEQRIAFQRFPRGHVNGLWRNGGWKYRPINIGEDVGAIRDNNLEVMGVNLRYTSYVKFSGWTVGGLQGNAWEGWKEWEKMCGRTSQNLMEWARNTPDGRRKWPVINAHLTALEVVNWQGSEWKPPPQGFETE